MIVYATHKGGRYLPLDESLKEQPEGKRNLYVNITNRCNCACTFCLRQKKHMAESSTLWLKREPSVEEVEREFDAVPWNYIKEVVFCGFGEPTMRLDDLVTLLRYVKTNHPDLPTRLNTNGLAELQYPGAEIANRFDGLLDTISISLNASNAERYYALTRAHFGVESYEAMLTFAQHCQPYVPNVVMTVVDHVESPEEIEACRKICKKKGLKLRVRPYEDH